MFIHSSIHSCVCACTSNVVLCILLLTPWGSYHFANSFCVSLLSLFECFLFTVKYSWGDGVFCVCFCTPIASFPCCWCHLIHILNTLLLFLCNPISRRTPILIHWPLRSFDHLLCIHTFTRPFIHSRSYLRCTITNSSVAYPPACRFLSNNSLASSWLVFLETIC